MREAGAACDARAERVGGSRGVKVVSPEYFENLRKLYGETDGNWLLGYETSYRKQHGREAWTKAEALQGLPDEVHAVQNDASDV